MCVESNVESAWPLCIVMSRAVERCRVKFDLDQNGLKEAFDVCIGSGVVVGRERLAGFST